MDYVKLINCMRCGMCLPACPTYKETFLETASPRGRVALIRKLQEGELERIESNYRIKVKDYPVFLELSKVRTVLASEQDQYLRKRGIIHYSATGIGEKVQWRDQTLYRYVLAFNADKLDETLQAPTFAADLGPLQVDMRDGSLPQARGERLEQDRDEVREEQDPQESIPEPRAGFDQAPRNDLAHVVVRRQVVTAGFEQRANLFVGGRRDGCRRRDAPRRSGTRTHSQGRNQTSGTGCEEGAPPAPARQEG